MSQYRIEIDDDVIFKNFEDIINEVINRKMREKYSGCGEVVTAAVKDLIYSRKDEIIEMVVERATREIVKKGLPKLIALREEAHNGE